MAVEPLSGCEFCQFWSRRYCLRNNWGWPSIGDLCKDFQREPGVDG